MSLAGRYACKQCSYMAVDTDDVRSGYLIPASQLEALNAAAMGAKANKGFGSSQRMHQLVEGASETYSSTAATGVLGF